LCKLAGNRGSGGACARSPDEGPPFAALHPGPAVPRARPSPHCAPEGRRFMRATALALAFPESREKSREFAIFPAILAFLDVNLCSEFRALHINSLPIGAGNVLRRSREFI
jgi:hypothetical protein